MLDRPGARGADRDDLVDALAALGMGRDDAEAYVRLSSAGPQKAGALAKLMGWSRPETYRVLQRLVEREFVEAALTRPVRFRAVPVDRLFEQLQRLQHDRLTRLDESRALVEDALGRLQERSPRETEDEGLRVIHGRELIHAAAERMVAEATSSILLAATSPFAVRALARSGILGQAARRARTGLDVRLVLGAAEDEPATTPLPDPALVRRPAPACEARLVVADGGQALCWLASVPSPRLHEAGEAALWTNARHFVAMQAGLFDLLWARSSPP